MDKISAKDHNVYVHTHYQHFKKTVENIHFKNKMKTASAQIRVKAWEPLIDKRTEIEKIQESFLQVVYPGSGGVSTKKNQYKKDIKEILNTDMLAKSYLEVRDDKINKISFNAFINNAFENTAKDLSLSSRSDQTTAFLKQKLNEYMVFFGEIAKFLDIYFDAVAGISDTSSKNTILGMRNRAASIAKMEHIGKKSKAVKPLIAHMKGISTGKIKTYGLNPGTQLISTMFRAVNETMYELVSMHAILKSFYGAKEFSIKQIQEMFESGKMKYTGPAGQKSDKLYATTDFIIKYGTMNIGFDVKANREIYGTSYTESNVFYKIIRDAINGDFKMMSPTGLDADKHIDHIAYALTNMMVMSEINSSAIKVPNAEKVNLG
jgi:hypothetical protein